MSNISPLNHFEYALLDIECTCNICTNWRDKRMAYEQMKRLVKTHSMSCFCWRCCKARELHTQCSAMQNKRDIYCEVSWHLSLSKVPNGKNFMKNLEQELIKSEESVGWWAKIAPCMSIDHWLWVFSTGTPQVSGIVV